MLTITSLQLAKFVYTLVPLSYTFLHSRHADFSSSKVLRGHILKVATLMAAIISLLSSFLLYFPATLKVIHTSLLKKFRTKIVAQFGLELLSLFLSSKNRGLKTSVMG